MVTERSPDKEPSDALDKALTTMFRRRRTVEGDYRLEFGLLSEPPGGKSAAPLPMPETVGRYEVLGELGRGGVGVVYRVYDPQMEREVALKLCVGGRSPDDPVSQGFVDEARHAGALRHPGIVPIYEIGCSDQGRHYFTMEIVEGDTLAELLTNSSDPVQDRRTFLEIFAKLCQALAYAHARGTAHGDVKPSNAMVGAFGEVRLMDWGFAQRLQSVEALRVTDGASSTTIVGTPAFMSPERARGEPASAAADVFGLGGILCQILTGRPPYVGDTRADVVLRATNAWQQDTLDRLAASPADEELRELTRECLAADPTGRPDGAAEVAARISAHLARAEERARRADLSVAEARARAAGDRRARRLAFALAAITVVAAVVGAVVFSAWSREHDRQLQDQEAAVMRAIDRATIFRDRAMAASVNDLERWKPALLTIEQAVASCREHGLAGSVMARATELFADVRERDQRAGVDADMLFWLDEVAPHLSTDVGPGRAWRVAVAKFDAFGLDLRHAEVDQLVAAVRRSPLRGALIRRLDFLRGEFGVLDVPLAHRTLAICLGSDDDVVRRRIRRAMQDRDLEALRALSAQPDDLDDPGTIELLALGLLFADPAAAEALCRATLSRFPQSTVVSHMLCVLLRRKQPRPVDELLQLRWMAVAAQPRSAHLQTDLAALLVEQGRFDDADRILRRLNGEHPGYARAWGLAANWCVEKDKLVPAGTELRYRGIDALQRQRALVAGVAATGNLGMLWLSVGELARAEPLLREAVGKWHGFEAQLALALGSVCASLGRSDDAVRSLRRAVALAPDDWEKQDGVHAALGKVLWQVGQFAEAERHLELARELAPPARRVAVQATLQAVRATVQRASSIASDGLASVPTREPATWRALAGRQQYVAALECCRARERTGGRYDRLEWVLIAARAARDLRGALRDRAVADAVRWLRAGLEDRQGDSPSLVVHWNWVAWLNRALFHSDLQVLWQEPMAAGGAQLRADLEARLARLRELH